MSIEMGEEAKEEKQGVLGTSIIGPTSQITLIKRAKEILGVKPGDLIMFENIGDRIYIEKANQ